MRRKRCPRCDSLNTVPYIAGNKEKITSTGWICDNCDCSWDSQKEALAIRSAREQARKVTK